MDLTEAQTRAQRIDVQLELAGWNVRDRSQVIEELEIHLNPERTRERPPPTEFDGKRFSDYGLLLHGEPAAVIEAKRTSRDAELGKEQALQYAQQLRAVLHLIHLDNPAHFLLSFRITKINDVVALGM